MTFFIVIDYDQWQMSISFGVIDESQWQMAISSCVIDYSQPLMAIRKNCHWSVNDTFWNKGLGMSLSLTIVNDKICKGAPPQLFDT